MLVSVGPRVRGAAKIGEKGGAGEGPTPAAGSGSEGGGPPADVGGLEEEAGGQERTRSRRFKAEAHRQSVAVAESPHAKEDEDFIAAISDLDLG